MAQVARTLETVYTAIPAREIANADDFDDNDPVVAAAAAADAAVAAITDKSTQSTMDALSSSCLSTADGTFLSYFSFVCVRVAYFAFAQSIHQKNLKNDRREGQKLSQTQTRWQSWYIMLFSMDNREMCVNELMQTEKKYVQDLKAVVEVINFARLPFWTRHSCSLTLSLSILPLSLFHFVSFCFILRHTRTHTHFLSLYI